MTETLSTPQFTEVRGVPREALISEDVFERELKEVLRPAWHLAGHVSEVAKPGDYLTYTLGREEIVVVRDADGNLNAYFNFCSHRGYPLLDKRTGHLDAPRIQCPYHGWNFSTADGACRTAALMPKDFDKTKWPLARALVADVEGFIFVSFSDEPHELPGLAEFGLGGYDTRRLRVVTRTVWDTKANWHLVSENNSECYHCDLNHEALIRVHEPANDYRTDEELATQPTRPTDEPALVWGNTYKDIAIYNYDGDVACQVLMPRSNDESASVTNLGMMPGAFIFLGPDSGFMLNWRPITAKHTRQEVAWLVHEDATDDDVDVDLLVKLVTETMNEDEKLCERAQVGVENVRFSPGPLNRNCQHGGVRHYRYLAWHMGQDVLA